MPNQAEISEKARGRLLGFFTSWAPEFASTCPAFSQVLSILNEVWRHAWRIGVATGVNRECQAGSFLKVADEDENMLLGGMLASRCCTCR